MRVLLLEVSLHNLDARRDRDKARRGGRLRQDTMNRMAAHIKLWRRYENGGHPTQAELERQAYLASLERDVAALPPAPPRATARDIFSSAVLGLGSYV